MKNKKITFTKKDLISEIYKNVNIPKDKIKIILEVSLDSISDILTQDKSNIRLEIRNFGVFEVKKTKPKPKARNPKTNEVVFVPSRRKVKFKPGKKINSRLKKEWNE
tara:strand:- start:362 stop:682 length:321 start_codon:yes stop_codon:yes gene_type:complete